MSRVLGVPFQSPLRYMPEQAAMIPVVRVARLPLTSDQNYPVCQFWIIDRNPTTGTEGDLYYLERFDASGDAIWTRLADLSGVAGLVQLTGDAGFAVLDAADNIDVLGDAAQGVSTSGAATTLTITVADATDTTKGVSSFNATDFTVAAGVVTLGDTIVKLVASDAGNATPVGNTVTITGAGGITTSAAGSTITITGSATIAGSFVTDAGTATPAANVINILGGTGVNTAGAGATVTVNIDSPVLVANGGTGATTLTDGGILLGSGTGVVTVTAQPTDGQILIGSTGVDPVLATLTAGTNIAIANADGSVTIGVDGTITVPNGGTGAATFTPYTVICAGTTATGAFQNVASVGTSGQVLTSNGAGALPTFQDAPAATDYFYYGTKNILYDDFICAASPFSGDYGSAWESSVDKDRMGIKYTYADTVTMHTISTKNYNIYIGGGPIVLRSWMYAGDLNNATARGVVGMGLYTSEQFTSGAACIAFKAAAGHGLYYYCDTSDGVGNSITDTTVVRNDDVFHDFLILVNSNGTEVTFYIDDVLVATHTTNLPTVYPMAAGVFARSDSSGRTNYIHVDDLYFSNTYVNAPRA